MQGINGNTLLRSLMVLALVAVVACANPAADAPQAEVSEPAADEAAAPASDETATYVISDGSTIGFVGSKVTGSHDGGFNNFSGEISVAGGTPEGSTVNVEIDTTSVWADDERLTGHLKSADFFDVETYPTATFASTGVAANEDGTHTVTGNLTLHGVTKQIAFPATINVAEDGVSAQAEFAIKRFDFGIEYPGRADDLIRDDVLIKLDLKASAGGADDMAAPVSGEGADGEGAGDEGGEEAAAADAEPAA